MRSVKDFYYSISVRKNSGGFYVPEIYFGDRKIATLDEYTSIDSDTASGMAERFLYDTIDNMFRIGATQLA